jgi:hypothetical protein
MAAAAPGSTASRSRRIGVPRSSDSLPVVQVIETRAAAPADSLVLELRVYAQEGQIKGAVLPLAGFFEMRAGHVERIFLYALELCEHHGIPYLWVHDPQTLFAPDLRPETDTGGAAPDAPSRRHNPEPPNLRQGVITAETLTWFGFTHVGYWQKRADRDQIVLRGQVDGRPAVYIFIVAGEVMFVGAAHVGLKQRMDHYAQNGRSAGALRIRHAILGLLKEGRTVHILAQSFAPVIRDVEGLPIDMVAGTQAGLRRLLLPPWNRMDG